VRRSHTAASIEEVSRRPRNAPPALEPSAEIQASRKPHDLRRLPRAAARRLQAAIVERLRNRARRQASASERGHSVPQRLRISKGCGRARASASACGGDQAGAPARQRRRQEGCSCHRRQVGQAQPRRALHFRSDDASRSVHRDGARTRRPMKVPPHPPPASLI